MSRLVEIKITPISLSPDLVTVQEAKDYCRVDFEDDDSLFETLVRSSRERLERYCGRVFLRANCNAIYEQQGCGDRITLAYSDNISYPSDGAYTGKLVGESFIETDDRRVTLDYVAGYVPADAPGWMKQAVLMDVAYRYENRGDVAASVGANGELRSFVAPYLNRSLI